MTETLEKPQSTHGVKRYIGNLIGSEKGPTLVFFGGIHGNELAGIKALEEVFTVLGSGEFKIKGSIIGVRGNIPAQLQGKRFLKQDLNRLWTPEQLAGIKQKPLSQHSVEEVELLEIYQLVHKVINTSRPPFYFVDFHTTSSDTLPFITINDALINRKFSKLFPVPIILGIEEYLEGPLLSHLNEEGFVSLGFESGQHTEREAVSNSIAFTWLTLVYSGALDKIDVTDFGAHYSQLQNSARKNCRFYEVIHRHALTAGDQFITHPGFENFQEVMEGTSIGIFNGKEITMQKDSILFMPLYQEQGEDAFFLIRNIPKWALRLSRFLRSIKFDSLLAKLPGISWSDQNKGSLSVNLKIARFLTKPFFHLLGYRRSIADKTHILMQNRERSAKNAMYKNEWWF